VCGGLTLDCDKDGKAWTTFQLAIHFMDKPVGRITVLIPGHLTFMATKHLRRGDRVAVMGFLAMREWQGDAGEWHNDATLTAMDLELIKRGDDSLA